MASGGWTAATNFLCLYQTECLQSNSLILSQTSEQRASWLALSAQEASEIAQAKLENEKQNVPPLDQQNGKVGCVKLEHSLDDPPGRKTNMSAASLNP